MRDLALSLAHEGPVTRVRCEGRLNDPTTIDRFKHALIMALETDPKELWIDTRSVAQIDLEGITALLSAARWSHEAEAVFRIEAGPTVAHALDAAGLGWLGSSPNQPSELTREQELSLRVRARSRLKERSTAI